MWKVLVMAEKGLDGAGVGRRRGGEQQDQLDGGSSAPVAITLGVPERMLRRRRLRVDVHSELKGRP